jgi:catechol 2,3-dioxygenase-like lactoylglutathione lyase family enzyme
MLDSSDVIAFASAADLRQARAFYEQVLGLRVIEQNDFACVFDSNGTMLRVTAVAEVARPATRFSAGGSRTSPPPCRGLAARGVVFLCYDGLDQDDDGVWTTPGGDQVAVVHRPDRNVLSLTQFAF